jgi:PIN domain nuclease of toxin-antitoxin system
MARRYVVDAHALLWFLEGNQRLSLRAKNILAAPNSQLVLPIIALAEATLVIERGRTTIPSVPQFLARVYADLRIEIFPLTKPIFDRSRTAEGLRVPELHDRFIVSTGLYLQDLGDTVEIITKDQSITSAAVLSVLW